MDSKQTGGKRTGLVVALALCCILAVGGVFAWFSATTSKTNTFTQGGGITEPTEKPKPDPNPDGSGDGDTETIKPEGNIIETEWVDNTGINPDSIVAKNPNVGIGKKSKSAYVFVEVENALDPANAYFVLGDKWAPVDGLATQYGLDKDATIPTQKHDRCYTGGLFVYVGTNKSGTIADDMAMLAGKPDISVYTGEVFDKIYTNASFTALNEGEKKAITIKAYLAAASNEKEDVTTSEVKNEILTKAKAWAKSN